MTTVDLIAAKGMPIQNSVVINPMTGELELRTPDIYTGEQFDDLDRFVSETIGERVEYGDSAKGQDNLWT